MKVTERTRRIPVVVLTAGVDKIRQEIAQKHHLESFLKKPMDPTQLSEVAKQILG